MLQSNNTTIVSGFLESVTLWCGSQEHKAAFHVNLQTYGPNVAVYSSQHSEAQISITAIGYPYRFL